MLEEPLSDLVNMSLRRVLCLSLYVSVHISPGTGVYGKEIFSLKLGNSDKSING